MTRLKKSRSIILFPALGIYGITQGKILTFFSSSKHEKARHRMRSRCKTKKVPKVNDLGKMLSRVQIMSESERNSQKGPNLGFIFFWSYFVSLYICLYILYASV